MKPTLFFHANPTNGSPHNFALPIVGPYPENEEVNTLSSEVSQLAHPPQGFQRSMTQPCHHPHPKKKGLVRYLVGAYTRNLGVL
jgi:hypothetical protein